MTTKAEQITKEKPSSKTSGLVAVIRIRGKVGVRDEIKHTLKMMQLHKKNWCVVLKNTPENLGMVRKVKDFCTFGEVDTKIVSKLFEVRGRIPGNKPLKENHIKKYAKVGFDDFATMLANGSTKIKNVPGVKRHFKLKPPVGGFERGGVKKPFASGGALGYRGAEISKLIEKML